MAASSLAVFKIGMNAVEDLGKTHKKTAPGFPPGLFYFKVSVSFGH